MAKDWLIRTQTRQILGPVSREKLVELVEKGSLAGQDEICVGSGFWFFVQEKDLLQRFLYDQERPDFNPISEAPRVLTGDGETGVEEAVTQQTAVLNLNELRDKLDGGEGEQSLPQDSDLDYPEIGASVTEKKK